MNRWYVGLYLGNNGYIYVKKKENAIAFIDDQTSDDHCLTLVGFLVILFWRLC